MNDKLEHVVKFEKGYDCINFECISDSKNCKPGSGGSHGSHGLSIRFVVKGEEGAVQFLLYTGWLPQHSLCSFGFRDCDFSGSYSFLPADLGYHSKTPKYKDQMMFKNCPYCDGELCYYDGSSLNANDAMYTLVNGGDEALWEFLDQFYYCIFKDGKYPIPTEYIKPRRKIK
jgi:hypothetical protein